MLQNVCEGIQGAKWSLKTLMCAKLYHTEVNGVTRHKVFRVAVLKQYIECHALQRVSYFHVADFMYLVTGKG